MYEGEEIEVIGQRVAEAVSEGVLFEAGNDGSALRVERGENGVAACKQQCLFARLRFINGDYQLAFNVLYVATVTLLLRAVLFSSN